MKLHNLANFGDLLVAPSKHSLFIGKSTQQLSATAMMLSSAQKTVFQFRLRHPLHRAHTCQRLRQHLRLTGRQLQMRARDRKAHFCITALQPRTAVELPEGRLYKSTLLVYTVSLSVMGTHCYACCVSFDNAPDTLAVKPCYRVWTQIEVICDCTSERPFQ